MSVFKEATIDFHINTAEAIKSIETLKKSFSNTANEVKNGLVKQFGILAAGYFGIKAIKGVYDETKKLVDLSDKWNLPIEKISKFANTLAMFGGNNEEAISEIESLESAIMELKTTGGGALKTVANQIGLSLYDANGNIRNSVDIIEALRQKFKTLNKDGQVKVATELNLVSPATLRMLRASDEEYVKMVKQGNKFGVINEKAANNIRKIEKSVARLKQSFKSIAGVILEMFEPVINKVAQVMEWFGSLSTETKTWIVGLGAGIPLLLKIVDISKNLASLVLANPYLAIAAAAVLVIQNWEKVKEWFKDFIEWGSQGFAWLFEKMFNGINKIKSWFGFGDDKEKKDEEINKVKEWNNKLEIVKSLEAKSNDNKKDTDNEWSKTLQNIKNFDVKPITKSNSYINTNSHNVSNSKIDNHTSSAKSINISNVNITTSTSARGRDIAQEFLNTINRQSAKSFAY